MTAKKSEKFDTFKTFAEALNGKAAVLVVLQNDNSILCLDYGSVVEAQGLVEFARTKYRMAVISGIHAAENAKEKHA